MKSKIFLALFFLSVLACCKNQKNSNTKSSTKIQSIVELPLYNSKEDYSMEIIRLSEFVDSVKFIKLETTDENLIKDISKILFIDDEIVVVDKMGDRKSYLYLIKMGIIPEKLPIEVEGQENI